MHNTIKASGQVADRFEQSSLTKITDESSQFMSADQLQKLRHKTYGGSSKALNVAFDSFAKINGGTMNSCLQNDY